MTFHPYLNFPGNCREAFTFYQEVFGGDLELMTVGEMPSEEPLPEEVSQLIMHASLTTPEGDSLMASDSQPDHTGPMQFMYVNWNTEDQAKAQRVWDALVEGGTVEMPLGETFWSPCFGVCVDRFGTPWMINVDPAS